MKKILSDRRIQPYLLLVSYGLLLTVLIWRPGNLFMSVTDYPSQHYAFPDYFRKLFYATGDLFPDFAAAIGGGQNIYNFSYYGLFRPDVLISYLLPWIPTEFILMFYSILLYLLSGCLIYKWIRSHNFPYGISLLMGFLFLSSSVLFQSHRQIMFVNYMPFLIISLLGVDKYLKDKKARMLVIGIFLMILHSYYFSVSGLIICCIYFLYRYYHKYKIDVKNILSYFKGENAIYKIFFWMFSAVIISAFLLVPTALSMFENMRGGNETYEPFKFFDFNFLCNTIIHDYYGCGFSFFIWFTLCMGLTMKRTRIMSGCCILSLLLPIVPYILNGTLYTHRKVYLTFIPVILYLCAKIIYLKQQDTKSDEKHYLVVALIPFVPILCGIEKNGLVADAILTILILWYSQKNKKAIYAMVLTGAIVCLKLNSLEEYFTAEKFDSLYNIESIYEIAKTDNSNYRFTNFHGGIYKSNHSVDTDLLQTSVYSSIQSQNHEHFMEDVMHLSTTSRNNMVHTNASNVFYQLFSGARILHSKKAIPAGYKKTDLENIYTNSDVLPIAYGTSTLTSYEDFNKIEYPFVLDTLTNTTIVSQAKDSSDYISTIKEVDINQVATFPKNTKSFKYNTDSKKITINSKQDYKFNIELDTDSDIIIFCATVDSNNSVEDIKVTINGIKETLSGSASPFNNGNTDFEYVISGNKAIKKLKFRCTPGKYSLENIRIYTCNYNDINNYHSNIIPLQIKNTENKQIINGTLTMNEDGYFVTSIPYQNGLSATLDGKEVTLEKVNVSYAGFPITSGTHEITLSFETPGKMLGNIMSILGILMCAFGYVYRKAKNKI